MVARLTTLNRSLIVALVLQLGLAGTLGWLHLAAHDHAFSPDLSVLVDAPGQAPERTGVSSVSWTTNHFGVLLAISVGSGERKPASTSPTLVPPALGSAKPREFIRQRNPRQQPLLSLSPSLSPPLAS
jgi:hypothetical protein